MLKPFKKRCDREIEFVFSRRPKFLWELCATKNLFMKTTTNWMKSSNFFIYIAIKVDRVCMKTVQPKDAETLRVWTLAAEGSSKSITNQIN